MVSIRKRHFVVSHSDFFKQLVTPELYKKAEKCSFCKSKQIYFRNFEVTSITEFINSGIRAAQTVIDRDNIAFYGKFTNIPASVR